MVNITETETPSTSYSINRSQSTTANTTLEIINSSFDTHDHFNALTPPNNEINTQYFLKDPQSLHQKHGLPALSNWFPDSGATLHTIHLFTVICLTRSHATYQSALLMAALSHCAQFETSFALSMPALDSPQV